MPRNLKLLGLALAVVLAFCAISATGASAETGIVANFWCDGYPCEVHGEQLAGEKHKITTFIGVLECEAATFDGTPIAAASQSLTVHPKYEGCVVDPPSGENLPTTVTMNECYFRYTIHFHETANGPGVKFDEYSGQVHIICPEGKTSNSTSSMMGRTRN